MANDDGKRAPFSAVEDRNEHEDVRQVHAAVIGIVHDDGVALIEIIAELGENGGDRLRHGTEVERDGLGLRDHLSLGVAKGRREIHDVLHDLGSRDADDRVGHVVDDGIEAALDDGKRNRVNLHEPSPISITILPRPSRHTVASGGTTIVASNSSMISGPASGLRSIDRRGTIGVSVSL